MIDSCTRPIGVTLLALASTLGSLQAPAQPSTLPTTLPAYVTQPPTHLHLIGEPTWDTYASSFKSFQAQLKDLLLARRPDLTPIIHIEYALRVFTLDRDAMRTAWLLDLQPERLPVDQGLKAYLQPRWTPDDQRQMLTWLSYARLEQRIADLRTLRDTHPHWPQLQSLLFQGLPADPAYQKLIAQAQDAARQAESRLSPATTQPAIRPPVAIETQDQVWDAYANARRLYQRQIEAATRRLRPDLALIARLQRQASDGFLDIESLRLIYLHRNRPQAIGGPTPLQYLAFDWTPRDNDQLLAQPLYSQLLDRQNDLQSAIIECGQLDQNKQFYMETLSNDPQFQAAQNQYNLQINRLASLLPPSPPLDPATLPQPATQPATQPGPQPNGALDEPAVRQYLLAAKDIKWQVARLISRQQPDLAASANDWATLRCLDTDLLACWALYAVRCGRGLVQPMGLDLWIKLKQDHDVQAVTDSPQYRQLLRRRNRLLAFAQLEPRWPSLLRFAAEAEKQPAILQLQQAIADRAAASTQPADTQPHTQPNTETTPIR